jgi:hypothetical protein
MVIEPNTPLDALPQFLSVAQLQAYLGIGRSAAYEFGRRHGVRVGTRTVRIPRKVLEAMISQKSV